MKENTQKKGEIKRIGASSDYTRVKSKGREEERGWVKAKL